MIPNFLNLKWLGLHIFSVALVAAVNEVPLSYQEHSCSVDVAVIGAGFSGLSAARDLLVNANLSNGGITEVGAEFVGPTQDRVLSLISTLGLETYNTYNDGDSLLFLNESLSPYKNNAFPDIDATSLLQLGTAVALLDSMAAEIDVAAPWTHPNASLWDSSTFGAWLDIATPLPSARFLLDLFTTSVFSIETTEISLLYIIAYIASAGNETTPGTVQSLIDTANGAQAQRVQGGTQLIAMKLAESLGEDKIRFNAPVRSIRNSTRGYVVEGDGFWVQAENVVVAMAPPLAARIEYVPLLPAIRDQLTQRMPMGSIGKAVAIYGSPFWREKGLNGQVVSDSGTTRATFDNSPSDGSFGALMGFIEADEMILLDGKSEDEVQAAVLKDFVNYFGLQAMNVTEFVLQRWDNEEFSRGAPVAYCPPGVLTRFGPALRESVGGIHFAGTETALYWTGYMDGAIRSGERVAQEILGL